MDLDGDEGDGVNGEEGLDSLSIGIAVQGARYNRAAAVAAAAAASTSAIVDTGDKLICVRDSFAYIDISPSSSFFSAMDRGPITLPAIV
jgi:hypothetical protein